MLKFFRQIRQQLLMNDKNTKYFKYALGEIVLVVIGILIALQINNWNESHKTQQKEKELKASLIEATRVAKRVTDRFFEAEESNIIALEKVLLKWESLSYADFENLFRPFQSSTFSPLFNLINYSQFYDLNADVYNTAINDGSISILSDELLIRRLNNLYTYIVPRVNELMNEEYILGQSINNHIAQHYKKQFLNGKVLDSIHKKPQLWSTETYEAVFAKMRTDGVLKYKIAQRLELKKGRLVLARLAKITINDILTP